MSSLLALSVTAASIALFVSPTSATAYSLGPAVVTDDMNRDSKAGWGTADVGGEYSHGDPGSFSVNGSAGVVRIPAAGQSRTAWLPAVASPDARASVNVELAESPASGNGVSVGLQIRQTGASYYKAAVRVTPGGAAELQISRIDGGTANQTVLASSALPGRVIAGERYSFEFEAVGDQPVELSARAWPFDGRQPAWQVSTEDDSAQRVSTAGGIGVWTYASRGAHAATIRFDDLRVFSMDGGPAPVTPTPTPTTEPSAPPKPSPSTPPRPSPTQPPATPTPTPRPTTPPTPPAVEGDAGSLPIGSAAYPVPSGATVVSPFGSDNAGGTLAAPLRTVARAIDETPSGGTIVLRAGTYHEVITVPPGKRLTIQSYPREAVWFDGSSEVRAWSRAGGVWQSNGWKTEFDYSPTYTFGAPDGTTAAWSFVNPARPLAAHPDQVWIDGVAQAQVGSVNAVRPGTFYVDYAKDALYLGTDPTGKVVRGSDLARAIAIRGEGSILRGVGVRRYGPSVPHMGTITAERNGITLENLVVSDNATTGVFVQGRGSTVRNVTLERNGMLGASASTADRLTVDGVLARSNNTEGFNNAPVSGGFKIVRSRSVSVTDSKFSENTGPGLWFDESVYDGTVLRNDIVDNSGHGLIVEISAKFLIADNVVLGSRGNGMKLNDSSDLQVWNNTLSDNGRSINIVQDTRRGSNRSTPGHDPRQPNPDPTMTWITGPVSVQNNIVADTTAECLLCVEDYSHEFSAERMRVTANGNVYARPQPGAPSWLVVWSRGAGNPDTFSSVEQFRAGAGQDSRSLDLIGVEVISDDGSPTRTMVAANASTATPLPGDIAQRIGKPAGTRQIGAWRG